MSYIYNSPEDYGLSIFGMIEDEHLSYEFDMCVVWKDADGALWWAQDSGCSCPSPFESYGSVADLSPLRHGEIDAFVAVADKYSGASDLIRKVSEYLKAEAKKARRRATR